MHTLIHMCTLKYIYHKTHAEYRNKRIQYDTIIHYTIISIKNSN